MATFRLLHQLPEELRQDVIERLQQADLLNLQVTSKWGYDVASPLLWREVLLTDCRTEHEDAVDDHDDTPMIKVLLTLIRRPGLATYVQTLTHRCHLPPPEIFRELPRMPLSSQTLSCDQRTIGLIELAVKNLTNVSTLRIILGHPSINDTLLRCFFDEQRTKESPLRRLWLENCRISTGCDSRLAYHIQNLPLRLNFSDLESVRFRRLPLRPNLPQSTGWSDVDIVYARPSHHIDRQSSTLLQDGAGSGYFTSTTNVEEEQEAGNRHEVWLAAQQSGTMTSPVSPLSQLFMIANLFEERTYDALMPELGKDETDLLRQNTPPSTTYRSQIAYRGALLDPSKLDDDGNARVHKPWQRERLPSCLVAVQMLQSASPTLTSLCLDWVFTRPATVDYLHSSEEQQAWMGTFVLLFSLRFPRLRAFQLRSAIVPDTQLPDGLYLLDRSHISAGNIHLDDYNDLRLAGRSTEDLSLMCLKFMEAHQNLECLAWPMDHFFAPGVLPRDISDRVEAVMNNLGRTLRDLRVDAMYSTRGGPDDFDISWTGSGEPITHHSHHGFLSRRASRRNFVERFAPKMRQVRMIKMEGAIPRDERREVIRALHACPMEKLVMIGVCSSLGNTWGADGLDLGESLDNDEIEGLETEDKDAVWRLGPQKPESPPDSFRFEAEYGWPPSAPMLNTIASFHADTITELKFCGWKGSPALFTPTPITMPLLSAMKHFHNLKSLVMSLWLSTTYEQSPRDADVISYWANSRSPTSTALVRISDEEPEGWEKELKTKFAPDALAWRVTSFLGPLLSDRAKSRNGGVHVRAGFCVGDWDGIFDLDMAIGKGSLADVCLGFDGPRPEMDEVRRKSKLVNRRWF
ncbi:hypothetical protein LTR86_007656 [Recurvomyces mirabilis]|nr:hypothetical protein LTR86_007656 [Recurvomyces mirabilis]